MSCIPLERKVSMKSLILKRDLMLSSVKTSPLKFNAEAPFLKTSAARGISDVITKSSLSSNSRILLSAASKTFSTTRFLIESTLGYFIG